MADSEAEPIDNRLSGLLRAAFSQPAGGSLGGIFHAMKGTGKRSARGDDSDHALTGSHSSSNTPADLAIAEPSSVVAAGMKFEGNITAPGSVYINGLVEGDVRAGRVVIGSEGHLAGDLYASRAVISGRTTGEVWSEDLIIHKTGQTHGPIHCDQIDIRPGARIMSLVQSDIQRGEVPVSPVRESDQTPHDPFAGHGAQTASEGDRQPTAHTLRGD